MRTILIVLDSVGIGELPDAKDYGDVGSNTLVNIKKAYPEMNLKNMIELGISNIEGANELSETKMDKPKGAFGKMNELSKGKDTTVGHWEMTGVITEKPFPTFLNGFPQEILDRIEKKIGKKFFGNYAASGTEIIKDLGDRHVETGELIVYTSADSVFQIAAHEDIVPIEELYRICEISRKELTGEYAVSRVIARPFIGPKGDYTRTKNRKDFSLKPSGKTMLNYIKEAGMDVAAVGKIEDIFVGEGITKAIHTSGNMDSVDKTLDYMKSIEKGIIFSNLVDFDMTYGHRNDYKGYGNALMDFDNRLPEIIESMRDDDILFITADHGCDPTTESTDHSREYVPILVYGKKLKGNVDLGIRNTFSDIAVTILDYLNIENNFQGESFLSKIKN